MLFQCDFCIRTIVYVDGFNLYFRLLVSRPSLKWLNIRKLAEVLLSPSNAIVGVKYYTARVSGHIDAGAPSRQQVYFDALATVPDISVYMGNFLLSEKFAGLVKPRSSAHACPFPFLNHGPMLSRS